MLPIIAVVFMCALGSTTGTRHGGCPRNHMSQLRQCIAPIQRLQSNPSQNVRQMCRTMNRGLDCLDRIMTQCANEPDVAAMSSMLNMDQLRLLVQSECSGGPSPTFQPGTNINCPAGYQDRILSCVRPMQAVGQVSSHNIAQACGVVISGLACLDDILMNCAGQQDVQALTSMLNIDTMRNMVHTQCASIGAGSNNNGASTGAGSNNNGNCPSGYRHQLESCLEPMTHLDTLVEQDPNRACSVATDGMGCIDTIVNNCGDKPDVIAVADILDLENMRPMIDAMCSQGNLGNGGSQGNLGNGGSQGNLGNGGSQGNLGNGGSAGQIDVNDNCPTGYAQRLENCAAPMQGITSVTPENLEHACSVAQDGLGCIETILENCGDRPEVQALSSMVNIGEARTMIDSVCSGCAGSSDELQRCNRILSSFNVNSGDMDARCSSLDEGFQCFSELISRCSNHPAVRAFTSMVDIGEARNSMRAYCPNMK